LRKNNGNDLAYNILLSVKIRKKPTKSGRIIAVKTDTFIQKDKNRAG
jgi:hypothetical protein